MGLDMYLKRGKRIPGKSIRQIEYIEEEIYYGDNKELLDEYKDYIIKIEYERIKTIVYALSKKVVYWRKANAIHNWFVCNIQNGNDDGRMYEVKKEQLEKLLHTCNIVLSDLTLAKKLLPTKEGFFFGNTGYNRRYVEKLEETVIQLEKVLKNTDFDKEYIVYISSW